MQSRFNNYCFLHNASCNEPTGRLGSMQQAAPPVAYQPCKLTCENCTKWEVRSDCSMSPCSLSTGQLAKALPVATSKKSVNSAWWNSTPSQLDMNTTSLAWRLRLTRLLRSGYGGGPFGVCA